MYRRGSHVDKWWNGGKFYFSVFNKISSALSFVEMWGIKNEMKMKCLTLSIFDILIILHQFKKISCNLKSPSVTVDSMNFIPNCNEGLSDNSGFIRSTHQFQWPDELQDSTWITYTVVSQMFYYARKNFPSLLHDQLTKYHLAKAIFIRLQKAFIIKNLAQLENN